LLRRWVQAMTLTQNVLALHDGIDEAVILEERSGRLALVEDAARDNARTLSDIIEETTESTALGPALILGTATQFRKGQGVLRLVGILYGDMGIILTYFGESKLLAVRTETSSLGEAMQLMYDKLPSLIRKSEAAAEKLIAVKSAVEAGTFARDYINSVSHSSRIFINEISYHSENGRWVVCGTYRSFFIAPSKRFELEIDEKEGAIFSFRSTSSWSVLLGIWFVALLAMIGVVGWLLYRLFMR